MGDEAGPGLDDAIVTVDGSLGNPGGGGGGGGGGPPRSVPPTAAGLSLVSQFQRSSGFSLDAVDEDTSAAEVIILVGCYVSCHQRFPLNASLPPRTYCAGPRQAGHSNHRRCGKVRSPPTTSPRPPLPMYPHFPQPFQHRREQTCRGICVARRKRGHADRCCKGNGRCIARGSPFHHGEG